MRMRKLGKSGLAVSEIGFGTWGIGGFVAGASYGATDDRQSLAALRRAADLGINFFDTADAYGDGHAESLLGDAFGTGHENIVIATKAGHPRFGGPQDFSPAHLRRSVDGSLGRLKRAHVGLLQLHNPPIALLRERPEILACLAELQRAGKIAAWGLSLKTPAEALIAIDEFAPVCVQANFNLADQRALDCGLLDRALAADVAVIARTPLAFGFLSGTLTADAIFPDGDHRRNWPVERIRQWADAGRALAGELAAREGQSLAQIALRFCLSHPAVATAIPGMLRVAEVDQNAAASDFGPLEPADFKRICRTYAASAFAGPATPTPKTPDRG